MEKLKLVILFSIFIMCLGCKDSPDKDWNDLRYSTAKAYLYYYDCPKCEENEDCLEIITSKNRLTPCAYDKEGKDLSQEQIDIVLGIQRGEIGTSGSFAMCFYPHHGIVFYDRNQKPAGSISICFDCNRTESSPMSGFQISGLKEYRKIFNNLKIPVFSHESDYLEFRRRCSPENDTTQNVFSISDLERPPKPVQGVLLNEIIKTGIGNFHQNIAKYVVKYSFIIEASGDITFITVDNDEIWEKSKNLRITLNEMDRWEPGIKEGQPVRSKYEGKLFLDDPVVIIEEWEE